MFECQCSALCPADSFKQNLSFQILNIQDIKQMDFVLQCRILIIMYEYYNNIKAEVL